MELMSICLDQFYRFVHGGLCQRIPENILGRITLAVSGLSRTHTGVSLKNNRFDLLLYLCQIVDNYYYIRKCTIKNLFAYTLNILCKQLGLFNIQSKQNREYSTFN